MKARKILSILLCLVMAVGLFPVSVSADSDIYFNKVQEPTLTVEGASITNAWAFLTASSDTIVTIENDQVSTDGVKAITLTKNASGSYDGSGGDKYSHAGYALLFKDSEGNYYCYGKKIEYATDQANTLYVTTMARQYQVISGTLTPWITLAKKSESQIGGGDSSGDDSDDDAAATKTIQLGTSGLSSPTKVVDGRSVNYTPNSYIYFGSSGQYKWRVLDASKTNDGNTGGIFLLNEAVIENSMEFGSDTYQGSRVQTWVNGDFVNNNFTAEEQIAMLATTKTESSNSVKAYDHTWYEGSLDNDKMFLPSMPELKNYVGENGGSTGLSGTKTWWTRSKSTIPSATYIGVVLNTGGMDYKSNASYNKYCVRPAFNLDSSKVLFTSAAEGGKSAEGMDKGLTKVSSYEGSDWKVTLKDNSRESFSSTENTSIKAEKNYGYSDWCIDVKYQNATTGANAYISAMLVNASEKVLYYGRISQPSSTSGSASVKIPSGLAVGEYTLKVFNEQCNEGTDYASEFIDVKLTVKSAGEAQIGDTPYETLEAALEAASSNNTADTIEIIGATVTTVTDATLKSGDTLKTYGGDNEYKATTDATLSIDQKGNVTVTGGKVETVKGTVTLGDGGSATGKSGKTITNPTGSKEDSITVTADAEKGKDSVTVEKGKDNTVKIGDTTYTNGSDEETMVIEVSADGSKLTSGAAVLDDGETITGVTGTAIANPENSGEDKITVTADTKNGKDSVTVEKGKDNTVTIGDTTYTNGSADEAMVIEVSADGSKLTGGTVALDKDKVINVGDKGVAVKNTGDKQIAVAADGKVTVHEGGQLDLGKAKITDVKQETTFEIDEDGNAIIKLTEGEVITINGVVYTGGENGGTITIDPITAGEVIGVEGIDIVVSEDKLTEDFNYVILPGQSVTIGKYVYTAPKDGQWGDVTIWGRGTSTDGDGNVTALNPAVVLKNAGGTVDVALSENKETTTTYTAANASTVFTMSAGDTDTTKVDLLDNNTGINSALTFTDTASYVVNGVTYQAQTVKDTETGDNKAIAYTVTYGEKTETVTNPDGSEETTTVNSNNVSVEAGSKVIATMNTGCRVQVNGYPYKATNNSASIIIDSSADVLNSVSGNRSNLTEIKDAEGNVTGYEVRKRSSGGGSSSSTSSYTVKFDTNGGSELKNISVKKGQTIGTITTPTKNGYVFTGWYSDKELTKQYDDETKVTAATTLYAGWKVDPVRQLVLTIGKKDATVFGQTKSNDVAPKIVNDRTMLPARFVAENLGAKVEWNEEKQLVTITGKNLQTGKDVTILITIGSDTATVDGKNVKLDSPSFIENDRTYTPVRFISEELGANVEWDENTQQVIITKALAAEEK